MNGRRTIVGPCMLCALLGSAFAAQSASADHRHNSGDMREIRSETGRDHHFQHRPLLAGRALKGDAGEFSFNESFTIITIAGGKFVNNTFAAPGVNGCGGIFSFFIDPLVNSIIGLPSAAGKNSATLEGKLQDANAEAVKASE